jgi:hypothetical protein
MRDRYAVYRDGTRVAVADLPTSAIIEDLKYGPKVTSSNPTVDDIRLRLEIELIARRNGWPTKRTA